MHNIVWNTACHDNINQPSEYRVCFHSKQGFNLAITRLPMLLRFFRTILAQETAKSFFLWKKTPLFDIFHFSFFPFPKTVNKEIYRMMNLQGFLFSVVLLVVCSVTSATPDQFWNSAVSPFSETLIGISNFKTLRIEISSNRTYYEIT